MGRRKPTPATLSFAERLNAVTEHLTEARRELSGAYLVEGLTGEQRQFVERSLSDVRELQTRVEFWRDLVPPDC